MFTGNIQTVNMDGISGFERIDAEIRALVLTAQGTLPGNRAFGLEDYVDENTYDVENDFASALDEGCEQYIPEIAIGNVLYEAGADGGVAARVYVEKRDED